MVVDICTERKHCPYLTFIPTG